MVLDFVAFLRVLVIVIVDIVYMGQYVPIPWSFHCGAAIHVLISNPLAFFTLLCGSPGKYGVTR